MPRAQVGRPPKGGVAQERSETAKRAYVAVRLAQRSGQSFLDELGLAINRSALSRAGAPLLWHPTDYAARGRKRSDASSKREGEARPSAAGALRDWLDVDPAALDLSAALITFQFESQRRQRRAYRDLGGVAGVVQLLMLVRSDETQKYRLLAVALTDGESDRRRLRERFGEVDGEWAWQDIELQTVEPAVRTWKHLTCITARREGLDR